MAVQILGDCTGGCGDLVVVDAFGTHLSRLHLVTGRALTIVLGGCYQSALMARLNPDLRRMRM